MIFNRQTWFRKICPIIVLLAIALIPLIGVGELLAQDSKTLQLAPINPNFAEFWQQQPEHFYGYIPPPMDLSHLDEIPVEKTRTLPTLPSSFDWRDQNKVTSIKDQNPCGTCWVHGTLAAVESKVLIEESTTYDFSEQNLICCTDPAWVYLIGNRCMGGGCSITAGDTLTKKGTRLEACQPYNTNTIDAEACDDSCETIKRITDYRMIANQATSPDVIEPIKDAIYNHGPLAMSYAADDGSHMNPGNIYYWPDCPQNEVNHLVCIIGWDDTIAWPGGAGSGAWIVKNSWGTGWGNNGYFYLCYGSAGMCEVASFDYKDYDPNEKVYYWDEAGQVDGIGAGSDSCWMANIFSSSQDGSLTHVDFWTISNNAQYQIYVYLDGDISNGLQNQVACETGTCQEFGYYSISLSSPVSLTNGQSFTIAVKMTTPGFNYPIPVESKVVQQGKTLADPPIQSGKSYARPSDTGAWEDLATYGCNACLRGKVTSGAAGQPDITVNPTSLEKTLAPSATEDYTLNIGNAGDATLTYTISDRETTGPTASAGVELPTLPAGQVREREGLIQLDPSQPMSFPTPPATGVEIYYDDGEADDAYCYSYAGNGFAVRFTPPQYPVDLQIARFFFWPEWPDFDHEEFAVEVYDDDGGAPGTLLGGGTLTASEWGWCDVDISPLGITITTGDFYIAYKQLSNYPDCEVLGVDWTDPDPRSWDYWEGIGWLPAGEWYEFEYDYMIRCVVEAGEGNNPPNVPSNPSPANHATGVSADADLSWTGGDPDAGDAATYDVYFDTTGATTLVSNDQSATSYDPGSLSSDTKYYWKIVATDNHAASTSGPVWYFTTEGAAEDCPWLDESPTLGSVTAGSNSDPITVTIDTTGLTQGDYSAEIIISSNDPDESEVTVPVTLHVSGTQPTISFTPSSFSFSATEDGADPADQTLEVWNSGDATLSWSVSDDATWLSLSPSSGSSTGEHDAVTASVDISGMSAGDYAGTITISAPGATNTPQTVPVTLHVTGGGNNPPHTPSNPSPANHATGVSVDVDLGWTGGDPDPGDTVSYDVYFDTTGATTLVSNDQSAITYDPGTLNGNTTYYWKIVAIDNHEASTSGPVWDFTTEWSVWVYDEDDSGYIEIGELLCAINDYISGEITISQLLELINLYISHTPKP